MPAFSLKKLRRRVLGQLGGGKHSGGKHGGGIASAAALSGAHGSKKRGFFSPLRRVGAAGASVRGLLAGSVKG